jgi:hypothetical protein
MDTTTYHEELKIELTQHPEQQITAQQVIQWAEAHGYTFVTGDIIYGGVMLLTLRKQLWRTEDSQI